MEDVPFQDRAMAGAELGRELRRLGLQGQPLVLGLPRGGVPVAYEVARALHAPLDVLLVRKVGMPGQPEVAIGAIASGDITVHDPQIDREFPQLRESFERLATPQRSEMRRRERVYREGLAALDLSGRTVVLVDDGLATGCTMLAALRAARAAGAAVIVAAAPVASRQAAQLIGPEADRVVVLKIPPRFSAVGEWYVHFEQVDDAEVCRLLDLSRRASPR
jgi:putative phosphoribosyl transferase